jgi:hypothetical protein
MKQKTVVPEVSVWERIQAKQAELSELYREAVAEVYKETEGSAFLGEDNLSFTKFWLDAVINNPKVMSGLFNLEDFIVKYALFEKLVTSYNGHNASGAIMDAAYNAASQDVYRYTMDVKKAFTEASKNVKELKQTVRDAPKHRKVSKSKSPQAPKKETTA